MNENKCIICGEDNNKHYLHKLDCGHEFHYNCILKCFLCNKNEHSQRCAVYSYTSMQVFYRILQILL